MVFDPSKALDALVPAKQNIDRARENRQPLDSTREDVLAFSFKPGQVVRDKVTKKTVTVLDGQRGDFVIHKE